MNPPEEHLENYKRGDSEISRRYRELPADEVPPALDDAILAQAREDIQKTNRTRRWRQWTAPFALAASAVLALSILFRSGSERETLITQQAPQATSDAPAAAAEVPADSPDSPNEPSAEGELSAELDSNAKARDQVSTGVSQPALAASARAAPQAPESALEKPIREKLEEAPAPVNVQASQQFAAAQELRVPPPPSSQLANQGEMAADATPAAAPPAPAVRELKKSAAKVDAAHAAEQWLVDIRKLRAQGNIAEADNQWREFRKTFPDYTVPADDAARPKSQ